MPRYIRVNSVKQTFREDLRIVRAWKVLVLWIPKLFRVRLSFGSPSPIPVPFQDFVVPNENLIPEAAQKLSSLVAERQGFLEPLYQEVWNLGRESVISVANCRHAGGELFARIAHVRVGLVHPPVERITRSLLTWLADGRLLLTTDQRAAFDSAPNLVIQRQIGATLPELLPLHQAKLEELRDRSAPVYLADDAAMADAVDRFELESAEFNLRRGLYEEVSQAEATRTTNAPPIAGATPTDSLVLEEIEKLQNKRGSWRAAITVGLLSLVAFLGIGRFAWSWEFVLLLTILVMFHELGHYVAMRIFKYADVRMFFIPLLGAAVTGRHYNVKGWQRAIVYLAGPLPGIALGLVLMGVGLITGNALVEKTALIALLLNGINLLPFIPLDGGWVLHAILFSRNFILETAFLGLAGVALIGASWLGQGRIWFYIGILVLIGLPASYRLARIAGKLRQSGIPSASPDDRNIPAATALAILSELKQGPAAIRSPKHLARQTLDVFQKLNATPPGVLASLGFLALYLTAGTAAFLGTGAIFVSRLGLFQTGRESHSSKLPYTVDPAAYRVAGATNENDLNPSAPVIIAMFTNTSRADSVFKALIQKTSEQDRVILFGQTLFLSGPQVGTRWPEWFNGEAGEVFMEEPVSNVTCVVMLSCQAPDEVTAVEVEAECASYLRSAWLKAWPPWVDTRTLDAETLKDIERIHYTRRRIHEVEAIVAADPELAKLSRPALLLPHRKPEAVLERLAKKALLERALYRREFDKLAASGDPLLDEALVRFQASRATLEGDEDPRVIAFQDSALWKSASMPEAGPPNHPQSWRSAHGDVSRAKSKLNFNYLSFYRTDSGLPALVEYLAQRGCHDFRYELEEP